MIELYQRLGTYEAVGQEIGRSGSTVSKAVGQEIGRSGSTVSKYVQMKNVPQNIQLAVQNLINDNKKNKA